VGRRFARDSAVQLRDFLGAPAFDALWAELRARPRASAGWRRVGPRTQRRHWALAPRAGGAAARAQRLLASPRFRRFLEGATGLRLRCPAPLAHGTPAYAARPQRRPPCPHNLI
jgi:hypothetical protein